MGEGPGRRRPQPGLPIVVYARSGRGVQTVGGPREREGDAMTDGNPQTDPEQVAQGLGKHGSVQPESGTVLSAAAAQWQAGQASV